jgi:hypothetical protein
VIGLAIYANEVRGGSLVTHFFILRLLAALARANSWNARSIPIPRSTWSSLLGWIESMVSNQPQPLCRPILNGKKMSIVTDASEFGWAACSMKGVHGQVESIAEQWRDDDYVSTNLEQSVNSEPEGIWRAVCRFVTADVTEVMILTDHLPMVFAGKKGYASCFTYNRLLERLRKSFPRVTFHFAHVPGSLNPVDKMSRGDSSPEQTNAELSAFFAQAQNDNRENGDAGKEFPVREFLLTALNPLRS